METRTYFDIMGTAPATVTVVTTLDDRGRPHGLTVAAVTSVSAEPPILLVCIDRRSRTLPAIRQRGAFVVNFLRGDRTEVAERFASRAVDRFAGVSWRAGATGLPVLEDDGLAHAECQTIVDRVVGDHAVLFGRVVAGSPPPAGSRPLVYFRHRFTPWPGHVDDVRTPSGASIRVVADEDPGHDPVGGDEPDARDAAAATDPADGRRVASGV